MTEPSLALQTMIRKNLVEDSTVKALCPSVFDRHSRPETFPCILIGEGQTVLDDGPVDRSREIVFLDLHLWTAESGFLACKRLAQAVKVAALLRPWQAEGWRVVDLKVASTRYLRDPHGQHSHAVMSLEALMVPRLVEVEP